MPAQTEMGPGIAAEPHCAEREIAGLRFVPKSPSRRKKLQRSTILAHSLRRRVGLDRLPGLPGSSSRLPLRSGLTAFPSLPPGSAGASRINERQSEDPCSLTVRLRRSWSSPPLRIRCAPKSASASKPRSRSWTRFFRFSWQASSSSSRHQPSVRGPSWDHRLSRCPDHTLAGDPACGGETIISSGASCRLRFEDPPVRSVRASWGSPIVAKPNSTSSPCRRRSEVPFLSCRLTLAGLLEERAGCPPIT